MTIYFVNDIKHEAFLRTIKKIFLHKLVVTICVTKKFQFRITVRKLISKQKTDQMAELLCCVWQ